jgi:hypothetical protein
MAETAAAPLVRQQAALSAKPPAALLAVPRPRLRGQAGYPYGQMLATLIAGAPPDAMPVPTSGAPQQINQRLCSRRADGMTVAPEEAAVLEGPGLRLVPLPDVPEGSSRHVFCSLDVPAAWMARIDRAIGSKR